MIGDGNFIHKAKNNLKFGTYINLGNIYDIQGSPSTYFSTSDVKRKQYNSGIKI